MTGHSPQFLLKLLVPSPTDEAVRETEVRLKEALERLFPDLNTSRWKPASLADSAYPIAAYRATWRGIEFAVSYNGLARTKLGASVSCSIRYDHPMLLATPSAEIEGFTAMLSGDDERFSLVGIGQNQADLRRGGVLMGTKPSIALQLMARRAGLNVLAEQAVNREIVADLCALLRQYLGGGPATSVAEDEAGCFLEACFEGLAAHISPAEFEKHYGRIGFTWYRRTWLDSMLSRRV